jgi:methyl-accepting chemotaxis protein
MTSISKKVLLGYLLVLVVTILASFTLFDAASEVKQRTSLFTAQTLPELDDLHKVSKALDTVQIAAYSLYGTIIAADDFAQIIANNTRHLQQLFDVNGKLYDHQERKVIVDDIALLMSIMEKLSIIMASDNVDWDGARVLLVDLDNQAKNIAQKLDAISLQVNNNAASISKAIYHEIADIQLFIIVLLLSIIAVTIVAYALSHRKIALPMRKLAEELDIVAQNYDLTRAVPEHTQDEIGVAAGSINRLLKAFQKGINEVRESANSINVLVDVLGSTSENSDVQVTLLHEKIDSLLSNMVTLENQIAQGFEQSYNASEQAKDGAHAVEGGAQQVAETSVSISSLAKDIQASSGMLIELRKSGDQVSTVVSTIAAIADQTNLLALNAAIEAARAGESGRGFAVVADEVRTLATRTHQSTIEINTMLEGIVGAISQIVKSMENNQVQADEAVNLSQKTVNSLSRIQTSILSLSSVSNDVANQAEQSHRQVVDMRSWVEDFKAVGDAVYQGSMDSRDTSLKMTNLAIDLSKSVERFRV